MRARMTAIEEDEASLGQDEVMTLEKLSRDQRMNLNDSVFNLMLSQVGLNAGPMDKLPEEKAESEYGSENSGQDTGLPTNPGLEEEGSPEALTRKDTRVLNIVRAVSLAVALMFAIFAVTFVFKYTYRVEDETFQTEFTELAEKVVESFLAATRAKLLMTKSVAEYVSGQPDGPLKLSQAQFERVVKPQQIAVQAREVTWSPLLRTTGERTAFEQEHNTSAFLGLYPACYLCGSESDAFLNANHVVTLPGFGNSLTCGALEQSGRDGEIPSQDCDFLASVATGTCECGLQVSIDANLSATQVVFRLVDGKRVPEISPPVRWIYVAAA